MDVHQKGCARQLVAVAMMHASPIPCFVMQTTTVTTNIDSVACVANVEQELAADWCDLQDGVDDDDDVVS